MTAIALKSRQPAQQFDLPKWLRVAAASGAMVLLALCIYAYLRWMLGFSPATPWVHDSALTIHLLTVIPAIPLGTYVILSRKGGARHKLLGKIWLGLMFVTAIATVFIRNVNDGQFSWIHLFTLLTFISVPRAILSARQGRIEAHKKQLRNFFIGALVIAGLTAFAPGRTMWQWAFGTPSHQVVAVDVADAVDHSA